MNPYESLDSNENQPKPVSILKRLKTIFYLTLTIIFFTGCFQLNNKDIAITDTSTFSDLNKISLFHGLFVYPMSRAIILVHQLTSSTLIAIVSITVINRIVGFLFSFKATIEGEKMKEIQPLLTAINAKYAQKKDRLSMFAKQQEIQKVFKKHQINPFALFSTLLVSLPLFMGIYAAVKDNTYIKQFDLLGVNAGSITSQAGFNTAIIIAVALLVVTQFVSIKMPMWLSNKRSKKGNQAIQGKNPADTLAYIFPVMMFFIAYSSPISILVYFTVSPIFTILQSVVLHKYIVYQEQKQKEVNKPFRK